MQNLKRLYLNENNIKTINNLDKIQSLKNVELKNNNLDKNI
jgi:hypothetical protein